MSDMYYEYSQYNDFNRFINIDGIEAKIIQHLKTSDSKYANMFWKILKYDTEDALWRAAVSESEREQLIEGYNITNNGGQTSSTRLFFSPFNDDAWTQESTSVYIYVDDIYPIDHMRSVISVTVETVSHIKINAIKTESDLVFNAANSNPNDYYLNDSDRSVLYKSRVTTLLKCILAELNGLYLDGIGYIQLNTNDTLNNGKVDGRASLSIFNGRSFFGHKIKFNIAMSGVSDSSLEGV